MNNNSKTDKKVYVIGIDSASFNVIRPMIEAGELPNIAGLIKGGCSGDLESTFPPVTPPAWVSFMTGVNPGKHGVFDFYASPCFGYERPILNAEYVKARTLWSLLSEMGKKVGVINVPITYPPEKVNGFIIPGIQYGIGVDKTFTYPQELLGKLTKLFGEYKVAYGNLSGVYSHELDYYAEQWSEIHELRERVILLLMDEYPWDFFMSVFYSIDAIQHRFWKFFDKNHPLYDNALGEKYGDVIPDFYKKIDVSIGKILKKLDDSTTVIVVSDHGAGSEEKAFFLNKWLQDEGFLQLKRGIKPLLRFKLPHIVYKVARRLGCRGVEWTIPMSLYNILKDLIDPREGLRLSHYVDWGKSKAYAANHTEQGLYINLKGREPGGVVEPGVEYEKLRDDIIEKLYDVKDPETGLNLFDKIFKKEEIYSGEYVGHAPDIFFLMDKGVCLAQKGIYHKKLFGVDERSSGTHQVNGIFIVKGCGVKQDIVLEGCRIIDVAPTVLYLMGLAVPDHMDGKVLVQTLADGFVDGNPVKYYKVAEKGDNGDDGVYSEEESEMIKDSLRDLGYIG